MSKNRHIARHRASSPSTMQIVSKAVSSHAGTVGRPAAVVVAASGIMFGAALPASAGTTTTSNTAPAAELSVQAAAAPVAPAPAAPAPAVNAPTHTVQSGDTLGSIAASYGVSLDAIFAANGLGWESIIYPGQVISLSGSAAAAPAPAAPAPVAPAPQVQAAPAPVETSTMNITTASSSFTVADGASSGAGAAVLASAQAQLAAGAVQDCTRLVEIAMAAAGKPVGDLGPLQFADYGTRVSSPAPGDLVIRAGHVAIYAGNGQVISSGMNGANLTMQHPLSDLAGSFFVRL